MKWLSNFVNQQLLPGIYTRRVERKYIVPAFNKIKAAEKFELPKQKKDELVVELKAEIAEQADRKKGLEDKIKSILFVISVSITAITFCLKDYQSTLDGSLNCCSLILLGLSIFYFLSSALLSIKSLIPVEFYEPHPEIAFNTETTTISLTRSKAETELKELVKYKLLNDNINLRVQNATYSVLRLLRNGSLLFGLFFLLALYQKITPQPIKTRPVFKATVRLSGGTLQEVAVPYSNTGDTILNLVRDTAGPVKPTAIRSPVTQPAPAKKP